MSEEIAIKVEDVSKDFKLPHEKINSIKSSFLQRIKGGKRSFEVQHALKGVSFEVKKGEFFGVVGRNGSGKSTLLKILAEIYRPTNGEIMVNGKLVPFIELGVGFNPELTGRDNVYLSSSLLGFSRSEIDLMYKDIVEFSELEKFMDQKLKNYSSGMQVRLAFSIATRSKADILLIDEVLAVGDADFQRKCYNYFHDLKRNKKTVIFVSHDMSAVREFCDRAVLIEGGVIIDTNSVAKVSNAYTRLFMEDTGRIPKKIDGKRWGNGDVKYEKPSVEYNSKKIKFGAKLEVKNIINSLVLGFTVINSSGTEVMGTNTRIKQHPFKDVKAGDKITVNWEFPNILEDDSYTIALTAHAPSGLPVYDWWSDAIHLDIRKPERSGYAVNPDIKLTVETE